MDPITILAGLLPLGVELGKSLIARFIAPDNFKPSTIEQWTAMQEMQLRLFVAMNEAGGTNSSYPWVEAIVRLQRPAVAAVALLTWSWVHLVPTPGLDPGTVDNFAAAVGFYLFGDRTLFYVTKAPKGTK